MPEDAHSSNVQVLTDYTGWPVAVNDGSVWWTVAEIEPAEAPYRPIASRNDDEFFELQLTNGRVFIASRDGGKGNWTIACQKPGTQGRSPH